MSIARPVSCDGKTDILPATTNGEAQLIVGNDNFDAAFIFIDDDAADGGGLKRVDDEGCGIFRPRNDVDLFALHFLHDRLNAAALHADACADGVNRAIIADNADLGAAARGRGRQP